MALSKSEIRSPARPARAVESAIFGGEVIVRAIRLSDHLRLFAEASADDGARRFGHVCRVLAVTVETGDGEPVYTAAQWDDFGATQAGRDEAYRLFDIARELEGATADHAGN